MSDVVVNEVLRGFYLDSVALLRMSQSLVALDGVDEAAMMMGSPSNRQIMADAGILDATGEAAEGGDLVIGIRAESQDAADSALTEARAILEQSSAAKGGGEAWRPRSVRSAVKAMPEANFALISVPGDFAISEARKALRRGLHVMIFSDNVPVADEAALKQEALACGRLVMGPDCGTAIINGTPLAFANAVPQGSIGVIGASGTGIQEVTCLIGENGGGISHAIGVGGRDLSDAVGGITTLMALDLLDRDPATQHIVLISKPPSAAVAAEVIDRIGASQKAFTVCFVGGSDASLPANATAAPTLKAAAENALGGTAIGAGFDLAGEAVSPGSGGTMIRGLFSGGTLCAEAQIVLQAAGEAVGSNAPGPGTEALGSASAHQLIDLGADEYTQGRPHPMIEPSVRDDALTAAVTDASVGVILLDVVLGYGAHDDPAGHLIASLGDTAGKRVVASVTGTEQDPQRRSAQIAKLEKAGVAVAPSNADAASLALACLRTKT
jgi:FdrA protein